MSKIVILTGAGISAESGLSTFRDSNGLWENHRVEEVATPEAFEENPVLVWTFYSERRRKAAQAQPNAAHRAIATLAKRLQKDFQLITQNVDALHERSYSNEKLPISSVFSMHGSLPLSRCSECGKVYQDPFLYFDVKKNPIQECVDCQIQSKHPLLSQLSRNHLKLPVSPCCTGQEALLRPHIVWFGEMPLEMSGISQALDDCKHFITIGTSGNVYPAAGFLMEAKRSGAKTTCINAEPIPQMSYVDEFIQGTACSKVPSYLESLFIE